MSLIKSSSSSPFFFSTTIRAVGQLALHVLAEWQMYVLITTMTSHPLWLFGKLSEEDNPAGPSLAVSWLRRQPPHHVCFRGCACPARPNVHKRGIS